MESILKKISKDKNISTVEVFNDLERGQFESNILVLKDIERSFGKGSLEILSFLYIFKNEEANNKLRQMIQEFFAEEDEDKRQDLQTEIKNFVKNYS